MLDAIVATLLFAVFGVGQLIKVVGTLGCIRGKWPCIFPWFHNISGHI